MKLEKLFNMDMNNVSIDTEAEVGGLKAKDIFCSEWAEAKGALILIIAIVKNPIVKLIVGLVIHLGDGIHERFCGEEDLQ